MPGGSVAKHVTIEVDANRPTVHFAGQRSLTTVVELECGTIGAHDNITSAFVSGQALRNFGILVGLGERMSSK